LEREEGIGGVGSVSGMSLVGELSIRPRHFAEIWGDLRGEEGGSNGGVSVISSVRSSGGMEEGFVFM